jgi:hypothetical protein
MADRLGAWTLKTGYQPASQVDRLLWLALVLLHIGAVAFVGLRQTAVDYPVYVLAAYGFLQGDDVYSWGDEDYARAATTLGFDRYATPYRYPPLTALLAALLVPFPRQGLWAWAAVQSAAWLITTALLGRLVPHGGQRRLVWVGIGLLVPFFVSLYAGQVNSLATLLAAASLVALVSGRVLLAGWWLGLSLALKPLAIGLAGLLIWEGWWRSMALALGAFGLALMFPAGVFGPAALHFWHPGSFGPTTYPPAQNLTGLAFRWLTGHPYGFSLLDDPNAAWWAGAVTAAVVWAITLWACWPPGQGGRKLQLRAGLMVAATLATNPATWYHHATMLGIPLAALAGQVRKRPAWWWAALGLSYVLVTFWGIGWHRLVGFTPLLDLATLGMLGLWVLLVLETRWPN